MKKKNKKQKDLLENKFDDYLKKLTKNERLLINDFLCLLMNIVC